MYLSGDKLHPDHENTDSFIIISSLGWSNGTTSTGSTRYWVDNLNFTVAEIRILSFIECDELKQSGENSKYCVRTHCSCNCFKENSQACGSCMVPVAKDCREVCDARDFADVRVGYSTKETNAYVLIGGEYGEVFCDCSCNGSGINNTYGWVVIQRNVNDEASFDDEIQTSNRKKTGFGNIKNGPYWLGLTSITKLASENDILMIVLQKDEQDYYVSYRILWVAQLLWIKGNRMEAWTNLPQSSHIEDYFWIGYGGWLFSNDDDYSYANANWATKIVLEGTNYTLKEMKLMTTGQGCPRLQDLNSCPVKCDEIKTLDSSAPKYCRNTYCNCTCTGTIAEEWRECEFCILPVTASCNDHMAKEDQQELLKLHIPNLNKTVFPAYLPSKGRIDYCTNDSDIGPIGENCHAICIKLSNGEINNRKAGFSEYGTDAKIHIGTKVFGAYCDCTNDNNDGLPPTYGWIGIQRRIDDTSFLKTMNDYIMGFGDPAGSFVLGLDNIERLAGENHGAKLQIELKSGTERYFLRHNLFWIGGESDGYRLRISDMEQDDPKGYRKNNLNRMKMEDADEKYFLMSDVTGIEGIGWWGPYYQKNGTYSLNGPYDNAAGGVEWFAPNNGFVYYDMVEIKLCPDAWDCS